MSDYEYENYHHCNTHAWFTIVGYINIVIGVFNLAVTAYFLVKCYRDRITRAESTKMIEVDMDDSSSDSVSSMTSGESV